MTPTWRLSALLAILVCNGAIGATQFLDNPIMQRIYDPNTNTVKLDKKLAQFLSPSDFHNAAVLPALETTSEGLEAMSLPNLFEGDIAGIATQFGIDRRLHDAADIFSPQNSALNLETYPDKVWPDGRVPYRLHEGLTESERLAIAQAFEEYREKTCVRFVPKKDEDVDHLVMMRNEDNGCSSYVGRAGGNQTVSLEVSKCFTKGIIAHELMHSIGFFHEHSRTDRDKYVTIVEENVKPGMLRNFEKYPVKIIDPLDMPYDYGSVMHYHKLAFSRNGQSTIEPKQPGVAVGQRLQLSPIDTAKINRLYRCQNVGTTTTAPATPSTPATTTPLGSTAASTSPSAQPTSTATAECRDLNDHCEMWADVGHCRYSEKYMGHFCRAACKRCGLPTDSGVATVVKTTESPEGVCVDKNLFCPYWARIGECESESKFMKIFCRRSCDRCRSSDQQ